MEKILRWSLKYLLQKHNLELTPNELINLQTLLKEFDFVNLQPRLRWRYLDWVVMFIENDLDNWIFRINRLVELKSAMTLEKYALRYGDVLGEIKYKEHTSKFAHNEENYKRKYGEKYKEKLQEYKSNITNSLDGYISRNGLVDGMIKYEKFCKSAKYGKSYEAACIKYGDDADNQFQIMKSKMHTKFCKASAESLKIFLPLYEKLISAGFDKTDIFMGTDNSQEWFLSKSKQIFFYDFTVKSKKKIIEFHGSKWHPQKDKIIDWDSWRTPFGVSATERENIDNAKLSLAIENGFAVKIVFDYDNVSIDELFEFIHQ